MTPKRHSLILERKRCKNSLIRLAVKARGSEVQKTMAEKFGLDNDIRVSTLSKYPDVFTMEEQGIDEKSLWLGLEKAIRGAAEQFVESRMETLQETANQEQESQRTGGTRQQRASGRRKMNCKRKKRN